MRAIDASPVRVCTRSLVVVRTSTVSLVMDCARTRQGRPTRAPPSHHGPSQIRPSYMQMCLNNGRLGVLGRSQHRNTTATPQNGRLRPGRNTQHAATHSVAGAATRNTATPETTARTRNSVRVSLDKRPLRYTCEWNELICDRCDIG